MATAGATAEQGGRRLLPRPPRQHPYKHSAEPSLGAWRSKRWGWGQPRWAGSLPPSVQQAAVAAVAAWSVDPSKPRRRLWGVQWADLALAALAASVAVKEG